MTIDEAITLLELHNVPQLNAVGDLKTELST